MIGLIIVNWKSEVLIAKCLQHVFSMTLQPHRIVIIDNGGDATVLKSILEDYPMVELHHMSYNAGFAEGNNVGIRLLHDCKWIALLNPDAFPEKMWLAELLSAAEKHPTHTFFGSFMLAGNDQETLDGIGDEYHVSGLVWRTGHGRPVRDYPLDSYKEIFAPCAAAALYRKSDLDELGGFDSAYFCYVEDIDLAFRLRLLGKRCMLVPDAIVHHVGSATTGSQHSDVAVYYGHRNMVWTYFKNMPWQLLWIYLPQHILINIVSVMWFTFHGQGMVIIRSKWDALVGLPRILIKRKIVQSSRKTGVVNLSKMLTHGFIKPLIIGLFHRVFKTK